MSLARTLALLVAAGLAAGYVESLTRGDSAARVLELRRLHDELHGRLEAGVGRDPIAARAFADPGQIAIAVRAGLIEDLTARVARQYLQQVTVDLTGVEAHAEGDLRKDTLIGRKRVGEWAVAVVIKELVGRLSAGQPRLTFASNVLEVELPLEVQPASGQIGLHFSWDSAAVLNLVCKDFEVDLDVDGRALRQQHVLRGQIELAADDDALTATPVIHERSFPFKIELTPDSWGKVETALRSQDSLGRCGMFLDPENVLRSLRERVAEGIEIRLPRSLFQPVRLPARFERTVKVDDSVVHLSLAGERLRSSESMLWSSTKVSVALAQAADKAWISMKSESALMTTDGAGRNAVEVEVDHGKVRLHGTVDSQTVKDKGEATARSVGDVTDVRNLLQVVKESRQESVKTADILAFLTGYTTSLAHERGAIEPAYDSALSATARSMPAKMRR